MQPLHSTVVVEEAVSSNNNLCFTQK